MSTVRIFNHHVKTPFLLLGLVEVGGIIGSVYAAMFVRFWHEEIPYEQVWLQTLVFALIMLLAMISSGLYQARLREGGLGFFLRLIASYLMGTAGASVVFIFSPTCFLGAAY